MVSSAIIVFLYIIFYRSAMYILMSQTEYYYYLHGLRTYISIFHFIMISYLSTICATKIRIGRVYVFFVAFNTLIFIILLWKFNLVLTELLILSGILLAHLYLNFKRELIQNNL